MKIEVKNEKHLGLSKEQIDLINNNDKKIVVEKENQTLEQIILKATKEVNEAMIMIHEQVKMLKEYVDFLEKRVTILESSK
jgi:hypothetical protein